jgi:hypothetical protein
MAVNDITALVTNPTVRQRVQATKIVVVRPQELEERWLVVMKFFSPENFRKRGSRERKEGARLPRGCRHPSSLHDI